MTTPNLARKKPRRGLPVHGAVESTLPFLIRHLPAAGKCNPATTPDEEHRSRNWLGDSTNRGQGGGTAILGLPDAQVGLVHRAISVGVSIAIVGLAAQAEVALPN
jgi:hypothetical protein